MPVYHIYIYIFHVIQLNESIDKDTESSLVGTASLISLGLFWQPLPQYMRTLQVSSIATALFNSSPPSAAYMRPWTGSALIQVACHLSRTKPLPEPMLTYCQLDPYEQTAGKFELKQNTFLKIHLKMSSAKWWPFCPGGDEIYYYYYYSTEHKYGMQHNNDHREFWIKQLLGWTMGSL